MPSEKSTRSSRGQNAPEPNVEIITPLEVRRPVEKPDASRGIPPFRMIGLLLFLVLAAVAAAGFVFIRYLSRHPVNMAEKPAAVNRFEADSRAKKAADDGAETVRKEAAGPVVPSVPSAHPAAEPEQGAGSGAAEKRDAVTRLMESGRQHEAGSRFAFALADYQAAVRESPESMEAQKALNRVKERIALDQFQKLVSDGLAAYHDGNYQAARSALLKAKSFRPDSREVLEALGEVDRSIQQGKIESLRQEAIRAEQAEAWEQALASYLAVLEMDPDIRFAVTGKERSLEQVRVTRRISFFLAEPGALESDAQLQNALRLIDEVEKFHQKGPRLTARVDELKALVTAARTPVKVIIESDSFTEVAVYKVGRLGRFSSHELRLKPGTYTLTGSRIGYRDVRETIVIKPGQESLRVSIACREALEP